MKIVGILGRYNKNIDGVYEFECLEQYFNVFSKYDDVIPIMILPPKNLYNESRVCNFNTIDDEKLSKLDAILDMCDGFLLPGGTEWYLHDEYVLKYAIDHNKPLLGICLGMQIIGAMDNRFNDDIWDTTVSNKTAINHCQKDVDYAHEVEIIKNTLLHEILSVDKIKVNSRHNYHIDKVVNLKINAISEDGLIEALSYPGKKFILGVQWHPELLVNFDLNSKKIFDRFVNELH